MSKLPIPDLVYESIYELTPQKLHELGITLLLMDLDNTLDKYHAPAPTERLHAWIESLKAEGIEPFIYSNSYGDRAEKFATELAIDYINKAHKPGIERLVKLLESKNVSAKNTAIIGDQIYTDILCGKRAGITTIAITPIDVSNPFHFLRYKAEFPFRQAYKRRNKQNVKKD